MLPRATATQDTRESVKGKLGGRTQEISRLIGRSLRAIVDFEGLGRTRSSSTAMCCRPTVERDGGHHGATSRSPMRSRWAKRGWITGDGLKTSICAVSVGIVDGEPRLDLHYDDDVAADTDMNVVMTGDGAFVEVQGTAEGAPFSRSCSTSCSSWLRRVARPSPNFSG